MIQTTIRADRRRPHIQAVALTAATVTFAAATTGAWAMSTPGEAVSASLARPTANSSGPWNHNWNTWHNNHWHNNHGNSHHWNSHHWRGGMYQGSTGSAAGSRGRAGMWGGMGAWMGGAAWSATSPVRSAQCTAPAPSTQQITYVAMDMGQSMMGGSMMRLMPMWARVHAGTVTVDLVNRGSVPHELLVYQLTGDQVAGQRSIGADDRASEAGVLGEVQPVCDQPTSVDGIAVGNVGQLTLTLAPGRYEIVCNLPGHYRNGMFATLVVT